MALTDAQKATIFEIFGLPQGGSIKSVTSLVDFPGTLGQVTYPNTVTGDISLVVTELNTQIAALSASQETRVGTLLTRWDELSATKPVKISVGASGAEGVLADFQRERKNIRNTLANILGFTMPGSYVDEANRIFYRPLKALGDR